MAKENLKSKANKVANNLKDTLINLCNDLERYKIQQDTLILYYNLIKTSVEIQSKDNSKNIDTILEYARALNSIIYLLNLIDKKQQYILTLSNTNFMIIKEIARELNKYCQWFNKQ